MARRIGIVLSAAIVCTLGSSSRSDHTQGRAMTLESAAKRLSEIAGSPLRNYSTRDFGRERYPEARSVIVSSDDAWAVVEQIRSELGPGMIAFVGTTSWLGDEQHPGAAVEVVLAKGGSQFDILRIAKSDAINYGMETEDLIEKLSEYDRAYGIDILGAETDKGVIELRETPGNLPEFSKDLYKFCPDIVDQGYLTVEALEEAIDRTQIIQLWWD